VLRPIVGFHQDEAIDWVAELRCGHNQHVRHHPPFFSRPWVVTEEGRAEKLGAELPCVYCERFEMPAGFVAYKRTAEFTADSTPAALKSHLALWIVRLASGARFAISRSHRRRRDHP
jgi:hypothetical protein